MSSPSGASGEEDSNPSLSSNANAVMPSPSLETNTSASSRPRTLVELLADAKAQNEKSPPTFDVAHAEAQTTRRGAHKGKPKRVSTASRSNAGGSGRGRSAGGNRGGQVTQDSSTTFFFGRIVPWTDGAKSIKTDIKAPSSANYLKWCQVGYGAANIADGFQLSVDSTHEDCMALLRRSVPVVFDSMSRASTTLEPTTCPVFLILKTGYTMTRYVLAQPFTGADIFTILRTESNTNWRNRILWFGTIQELSGTRDDLFALLEKEQAAGAEDESDGCNDDDEDGPASDASFEPKTDRKRKRQQPSKSTKARQQPKRRKSTRSPSVTVISDDEQPVASTSAAASAVHAVPRPSAKTEAAPNSSPDRDASWSAYFKL